MRKNSLAGLLLILLSRAAASVIALLYKRRMQCNALLLLYATFKYRSIVP
jgi:hypothetical protein